MQAEMTSTQEPEPEEERRSVLAAPAYGVLGGCASRTRMRPCQAGFRATMCLALAGTSRPCVPPHFVAAGLVRATARRLEAELAGNRD